MSSKAQFREALKQKRGTVSSLTEQIKELKERIELREQIIENQRKLIDALRDDLKRKRKWYQFWK
jgi:predicted nuclease with TOPRIM domain